MASACGWLIGISESLYVSIGENGEISRISKIMVISNEAERRIGLGEIEQSTWRNQWRHFACSAAGLALAALKRRKRGNIAGEWRMAKTKYGGGGMSNVKKYRNYQSVLVMAINGVSESNE
jgi:hypothetical protein